MWYEQSRHGVMSMSRLVPHTSRQDQEKILYTGLAILRNHTFRYTSNNMNQLTWSSFISSRSRCTGRPRISSTIASIFLMAVSVAFSGWRREPNNMDNGLRLPAFDGISAELLGCTNGERWLANRCLGEPFGEEWSPRGGLGRLEGRLWGLGLGKDGPGWRLSREVTERRAGRNSSSESSKRSSGVSTSNMASYKSLDPEPKRASRSGIFLIWRGRLL